MAKYTTDQTAENECRRFSQLAGDRTVWAEHWEDVAARVLPSYSGSFGQSGSGGATTLGEAMSGSNSTAGAKRTREMVDATAALALPKFAAACESMLTPRGQTWHRLTAPDRKLMKNLSVREWYDEATRALFRYRYAPNANFASQNHEVFTSMGAFGTGSLFIDELDARYGRGVRYKALHLAETYFLENHQGIIDTMYRKFPLTARQAMQRFGREDDVLPEKLREAAEQSDGKQDKQFWFLHCVAPRDDYEPGRLDQRGLPYKSVYVCLDEKVRVREGGYFTFPAPVSRYVQAPGETYGRSPAMLALPDIKVLNEQKKTLLKVGHRVADPVILAHDDGVVDTFSMRPGAVVPGGVSAEGRQLVHALQMGNPGIVPEMMDAQRAVINDAFLVTLFQILVETPQMTATEVLQRAQEKGALLSPTMGRQQSEYLGRVVDRELDVLSRAGLLPPPPPYLVDALADGIEYEVVYESPLSRAQRAEDAAGLMRLMDWAMNIVGVTQDPSPLDHINFDKAMPDLAEISAVPARWLNDMETVALLRQNRAQQAQVRQAIEAAPAVAGLAKAMPSGA